MKIAIVDDNLKRNNEIKMTIAEECHINENDIIQFFKIQDVKNSIRSIHFEMMFLDVVMPKRDETPNAKSSFNFLNEIDNNINLKKPETIIGITANSDDISVFKNEFEKKCLLVIEATNSNPTWKQKLVNAVNYKRSSSLNRRISSSGIYCYTIHGIRTRGEWQQSLKSLVQKNINNVDFGTYKYGYFSFATFFIPFLRLPAINRFSNDLDRILKNNHDKRVIIFSHSFGTYILIKALEKLARKDNIDNICTIVLSGSVLNNNHDFKIIREKTKAKIINDCGSSDYILSLSEAFVPFAGMAGKVGFNGTNDSFFVNRIFEGSHSHYFDSDCKFMQTYWLPLFSENYQIDLIDQRKDSFFRLGILDKFVSLMGKVKEVLYLFLTVVAIYLY